MWNGLGIIYQYDTQQSYAIATLTILMHVIDMGYLQRKEIRRVRANTKWNVLIFIFQDYTYIYIQIQKNISVFSQGIYDVIDQINSMA